MGHSGGMQVTVGVLLKGIVGPHILPTYLSLIPGNHEVSGFFSLCFLPWCSALTQAQSNRTSWPWSETKSQNKSSFFISCSSQVFCLSDGKLTNTGSMSLGPQPHSQCVGLYPCMGQGTQRSLEVLQSCAFSTHSPLRNNRREGYSGSWSQSTCLGVLCEATICGVTLFMWSSDSDHLTLAKPFWGY
jgi:hypothetical protein